MEKIRVICGRFFTTDNTEYTERSVQKFRAICVVRGKKNKNYECIYKIDRVLFARQTS